ncbi:MAG: beta-lactamase family protein [Paraglaciecola sp.]|uniref:serine hydrolase domain-containing protein n=1 Tax=Paraglaciecola sp. TaxID=1920173 RepID=UPI00273F9FDF|nr:serine hydrolase domain-containing protein [Paraglaciecola sp.]MDP5030718.1 beta-lactamase family protein [Paraglaciecola sp.]MDP5040311.1 beta-lactamase family protein [Paraglaciecola sp.]MDP5132276.1 beta-lactamase family protein [Paraglaciecola sp.]
MFKSIVSVCLCLVSLVSIGQDKPLLGNDAQIEQWLKANSIPTLGLGVIKHGQLQQVRVFGELEPGKAAPFNTIFNVASLAKPITAMVTLTLVSKGEWQLDEPLFTYWTDPDVAADPRSKLLTTRHILSHQSGFPNWRYMNESNTLDFKFSPGTQYQYSGEGMEYLRKALENKFGKSLNALANDLIFTSLAMTDTQYVFNSQIDPARVVQGYDTQGKAYETIKHQTANAADDLLTSVADYGKFLVNVLAGAGLSDSVYQDMISHQVASTKGKHFGLGFEIYDLADGEYALSHGGSDYGAQTIVFILPKSKEGLIIFTNVDEGYKVYEALLLHYLGKKGEQIMQIEMSE